MEYGSLIALGVPARGSLNFEIIEVIEGQLFRLFALMPPQDHVQLRKRTFPVGVLHADDGWNER